MKHLLSIVGVVLVVYTTQLHAQALTDLPRNSFPYNFGGQSVMAYDNRYEGVKGTYTLFEEFMPGTIELNRGKFTNVLINYDAYSDNLLARDEKIKDIVQMRKDMVLNFVMRNSGGEEFLFTKESINGSPTFLLNLVRDTISLFCRVSKTIKKAEIGGAYKIDQSRSDEFVTSNTYYIAKGNTVLRELHKNKKSVLQAFPEFEKQLSAYLKKNKLDFSDYTQMKMMLQYVNTLEN